MHTSLGVLHSDFPREEVEAAWSLEPALLVSAFLKSKIPDKEGDTTSHNIMPDAEARFSAKVISEYDIYAIDTTYLKTALGSRAILVSLDKEDFIDKVNSKRPSIEAYHVPEFPY